MNEIIIIFGIVSLAASGMLHHVKEIDKQEDLYKRLERLERRTDCVVSFSNEIKGSSKEQLKSKDNQETGETDMAASTDTNIVFRCSKSFKAQIQDWAKEHDFNLSQACRILIKLELNNKQALVDSIAYTTNYVNYLRTIGLIAADVDETKLAVAAMDYAAYMSNPDKQ